VSYLSKTLVAVGALGLATVITIPAAQAEQGDWLIKGGATMVSPKSNNLKLGDLGDIPGFGTVTDASVEVGDATSFGFTVTYMITDNWAVELLAAVPFQHDIKLAGSIDGERGSVKAATTDQLPPTLSLQYYFMPDQTFSPYIGVGLNMTIFSSEKLTSDGQAFFEALGTALEVDLTNAKLKLDDSTGVAAQIGADIHFSDSWFATVDVRYIDIGTKPTVVGDGGEIKFKTVNIDPMVYSLMIGYRF
jgi:outer membrane protein